MSLLTSFLKLFKWNTTDETDLEQEFDIDKAMTDNWDKLDEAIEDLDTNKVDKVDGKGLSTNDYTNEDKAKLDSLENYDDTEIKQDIEDIQANDAKQDELIQKLKDNSINVTTDEATSLQVQDASTLPARLEVRGNHSQETREGYNIWDYLNVVKASAGGLTIEKDYENGYIIVNGTPNENYVYISSSIFITDMLEDGQRYTLWQEIYGGEGTTDGIYLQVTRTADNETTVRYYSRNNSASFLVDKSNNASYSITLQTSSVDGTGTLTNYRNRYMLYKGTDEKSYELPGAMPSLDYPSKVRAVGDNVNVLPNNAVSTSHNGVNYTINEDGSIYAVGTATSNSQVILAGQMSSTEEIMKLRKGVQYKNVGNVDIIYRDTNLDYARLQEGKILTVDENVSVGCFYLQVNSGTTVDETYYPKLVEYYEGMDESYSPYGQGSVEIKKINKNYYDVGKSINDYFVTAGSKGATITQYNASNYVECDIIEGIMNIETYNTSGWNWIAKWLKINKNTNYTISLNKSTTSLTVLGFNSVETGITGDVIAELGSTNSKTTFNSGNYEYYAVSFYPPAGLEIAIQVEAGDLNTNFEEHQEQSYILDIQKPMLEGDYFVKEADGWKEVHGFNKKIFDGTENIGLTNNQGSFSFLVSDIPIDTNTAKIPQLFSNCYEACSWEDRNGNNKPNTISYYHQTIGFDKGNLTTVDEFKQLLSQKNAEGNSVYVYYPVATPTKLPCTEAQSNVLNQLNELELFKGTNNIITAESLALMQMQYIADTQSYIDSKLNNINQQILEIAGGN